ncbi:MAG: STAS domain-containing protein [Magnetococcales bacterium]|nr:STAS domain-containing protein [Magnetococcales bacterium]MBF0321692.1 STAS domain-containing protein [Magnetococcales bacterium]
MYTLAVEDSGTGTLTLAGDLTIQHARELKEALIDAVTQSMHLNLNFKDVERVDLAGLQILCAAHRSLLGRSKTLAIVSQVPDAFKAAVKVAGYDRCIEQEDPSGLWRGGN